MAGRKLGTAINTATVLRRFQLAIHDFIPRRASVSFSSKILLAKFMLLLGKSLEQFEINCEERSVLVSSDASRNPLLEML